jgi:hypothetical protein
MKSISMILFIVTLVLNVVSLTFEIYIQLNKNNIHRYRNLDDKPYVMLIYLYGKRNDRIYCIHIELVDHGLMFYDEPLYEHY